MSNPKTISWIFLALAFASENAHVDRSEISKIADGINHCLPTEIEINDSLFWLENKGLVTKNEMKYSLTEIGKRIFSETRVETKVLFKMIDIIEQKIESI